VPIDLHFSKGRIKLAFGLAKGKRQFEKRDATREKDWKTRTAPPAQAGAALTGGRRAASRGRSQTTEDGRSNERAPRNKC